ncbi:MAG TPA: sugar phosphate isomerase/epimerase [Thermoleophilaceae bacterium]|nr:sugar phosphate isomerase/epimerase [Thermoleophilaceae bacterium]
MPLRVANAPNSWGIEDPADPANAPWPRVLDETATAGYRGTELGPLGYLPQEPATLRRELAARELELVAGFVFAFLHTPEGAAEAVERARATCRLLTACGARYLVIGQEFTPERERSAGRAGEAAPLDDAGWAVLTAAVHAIARVAREHGIVPCFHPHAGTYVEFEPEIERLIDETDPELVRLCIDTGHCAYAAVDPVELYRRHADRVAYFHLKDLRPEPLRAAPLSFEQAVAARVFCPLGEGVVDFEALAGALREHGFDGWGTVEQDRPPDMAASTADEAAASLRHLHAVGLAA